MDFIASGGDDAGASEPITLNFAEMIYHFDGIAADDSGVYVISGGSSINQNGYVVLLRRSE